MNLNEQAAKLTELRDQILTIADAEGDLSPEDAERYESLNVEFDELKAELVGSRFAIYGGIIDMVLSREGAYMSGYASFVN